MASFKYLVRWKLNYRPETFHPPGRQVPWPILRPRSLHVKAAAVQAQPEIRDCMSDQIGPGTSASQRLVRNSIKNAKPFLEFLTDRFNRQHDYLRISITERCNLRCLYCMPEEGVTLSPQSHNLTSPEIFYLASLFVSQGVTKIRLTGGEPTVRKDIVPLMQSIGSLRSKGLRELALTTNGISLYRKLDSMIDAGLTGVNLSLDTLDSFQYQIMTRRNGFEAVMKSINRILDMKKTGAALKLKINCVVIRGLNEREIVPFVEMGRDQDLEVRFIEYMPFGGNKWNKKKMVSFQEMLEIIKNKYPDIHRVKGHRNDTSKTYQVPGFAGKVGFITSMTNDFCGTCNRLRITSDGNLKVCLHGNTEVSLRDILREATDGKPIDENAFETLKRIESENIVTPLSDETPFGWGPREQRLLDIIGAAVKRKKEKHAGMGELENMTNRPMILIDSFVPNNSSQRRTPVPSKMPLPKPQSIIEDHTAMHYLSHRHPCINASSRPTIWATRGRAILISSQPLARFHSVSARRNNGNKLPHLTSTGEAHMVNVSEKSITNRRAIAVGRVLFGSAQTANLINQALIKKGDVLGTARLAGIMAAKTCPTLIPLCHPIIISGVRVDVRLNASNQDEFGDVSVESEVTCVGQTGVEMEALTSVTGALLTVIDMVKSVDREAKIDNVRLVLKDGGRSGLWRDKSWVSKIPTTMDQE